MADRLYKLYIDESGAPELSHHDKNYTLSGIIVRPFQAEKLKIRADQIKFKYWNNTEIVFHSIDIGQHKDDFTILNNPSIERDFHRDLFGFLSGASYKVIVVSINKEKASKQGWDNKKIQDSAFDGMIELFIAFLAHSGYRGQIHMESSGGRDTNFHRRFISYMTHGYPALSLSHTDVKNLITSISFVSKKNHDIEAQLADLFAYPSTRQCLHNEGVQPLVNGSYEAKICNIMGVKLISTNGQKGLLRIP